MHSLVASRGKAIALIGLCVVHVARGDSFLLHVARAAVPQGMRQRAVRLCFSMWVERQCPRACRSERRCPRACRCEEVLLCNNVMYCVAHCFFGCRRFKPKQGQLSHRHCGRKRAFGSIVGTSSGRALFRWHRFSSSMLQAAGEGEVVVVATAGFATSGGCPGPPAWTLRDRSSAKSTAKGVLCLFAACQVQRHGGPRAVSGGRAAMPPPKTGRRARGTATFPGTCKTA